MAICWSTALPVPAVGSPSSSGAQPREAGPVQDGENGSEQPRRLHVLLVEDDPATSKALSAICRRRGWDVTVAATLAETWPVLTQTPDVVVIDLMLPDGDGLDILSRVRAENIPARVVVTTGSSDPARIRAVRALAPDLFLTKPINLQDLLDGMGPAHD